MPFTATLSQEADALHAAEEVCRRSRAQMEESPDLALLFLSAEHAPAAEAIAEHLRQQLTPRCLLGCTGEAIVANDQEIEDGPTVCLWLARWASPVRLQPFHLFLDETPDGYVLLGWPEAFYEAEPSESAVLLFADPFTFPADAFLQQMNEAHPSLRVMGGMASGARSPGQARLILDDQVLEQGAAGVLLQGRTGIRSVVSQGCRPIGRHMVITKARDNIILELGGKTPLVVLEQLWQDLNAKERTLFQQGLHVGRVINEYQAEFHRGDFLVRNVMQMDRETGALAITDRVRVGQTVQFHIRDAETAGEDLHELLKFDLNKGAARPASALVFTCNGRGRRLFAQPHHDAQGILGETGPIPLAGFFAQGELGPVGGKNFIHGFTASIVLFPEG